MGHSFEGENLLTSVERWPVLFVTSNERFAQFRIDPDVNFAKRRKFIEQAELFTGGCGESFATLSSPPMNNSKQPISPLKNYGCSPFFNGLYSETVYSNAAE
jgi:hypothetical protein